MNRRNFLRTSGTLSAAGLIASPADFSVNKIKKGDRVLILGAGFAGLAAGYYLKKNNIPFTLLEARNRIGGRIFTQVMDEESGLHAEMGGEWVGASHPRMLALCKELGLNLLDHRFETHLLLEGIYAKNKQWTYDATWTGNYKNLLADFKNLTEKQGRPYDAIDWWRFLSNQGISERDLEIRELLDSTDFGECIRNVSAYLGLAEYAFSGEHNEMDFRIEGGNSRFAQALAEKIGPENILLGKKAVQVRQDRKDVTVVCEDGSQHTGARLICTVPVFSIPKINWQPSLPAAKLEALNELQYSRIIKSVLVFSERFWQDEAFDMITDTSAHYFFHSSKNQPGPKGTLTSYAVGDKAQMLAKMTDEQKKREICAALRPAFGEVLPYAQKVKSYYWGNDPYSKGAYAIYDTRQWFGVREEIGKPFRHISFAGEHLADWQGFMEGAVQTGEDAAKALVG